jgi:hypothetical protein
LTFATAKYSFSLIGSAVAMKLSCQKRCFHLPLKQPIKSVIMFDEGNER